MPSICCPPTPVRPFRWPRRAPTRWPSALGARFVVVKALSAARRLRPDINLLMVIAVCGALGIGEWFEAATVTFLFSLSLALEGWSIGRARRAIAVLLDLAPPTARLKLDDGEERDVPAVEVPVGSRFVVMPGEKIPLDGEVAAGASAVDQAPITGESVPAAKRIGSSVFAGTINGEGVLEVESTKSANGHDPGPHHSPRRGGAQPPGGLRAMGGEVRPRLHARRHRPGGGGVPDPAAGRRRLLGRLVLPGAGAAGHRLPLRPGDFDARQHRLRPRLGGPTGRPGQGRHPHGSAGPASRRSPSTRRAP